jgi:hypothetical protein
MGYGRGEGCPALVWPLQPEPRDGSERVKCNPPGPNGRNVIIVSELAGLTPLLAMVREHCGE